MSKKTQEAAAQAAQEEATGVAQESNQEGFNPADAPHIPGTGPEPLDVLKWDRKRTEDDSFDEFADFKKPGDSYVGKYLGTYQNENIGEDGFDGFLFEEYPHPLNSAAKITAMPGSYAIVKWFEENGADPEKYEGNVFRITLIKSVEKSNGRKYNHMALETAEIPSK